MYLLMNTSRYFRVYAKLFLEYELQDFTISMASKVVGTGKGTPISILLNRMVQKGFLERVARGRYRVVHPITIVLDAAGYKWRRGINPKYHSIIEYLVSQLFMGFGDKLVSILLFGSLARGEEKKFSDIDFIVIVDGAPSRYGERVDLISSMISGIDKSRIRMWERFNIYPDVDMIVLDRSEAYTNHPILLDMIHDSIIIYDREGFMKKRLMELKEALNRLGAMRIQLPNGKYYWVLKPDIKWGEAVEV